METINKNKSLAFTAALICCLLSSSGIKSLPTNVNVTEIENEELKKFEATGKCEGCNLQGADLKPGIKKANEEGVTVDLEGADLTGADLSDSDLKGANFKNTNCTKALFKGSNLENTSWEDAILYRTYMDNTNRKNSVLDFKSLNRNSDFKEKIIKTKIKIKGLLGVYTLKIARTIRDDDPILNEKKYPALYDTKFSNKENYVEENKSTKKIIDRIFLFNDKGYAEHNRRKENKRQKKEQEDS